MSPKGRPSVLSSSTFWESPRTQWSSGGDRPNRLEISKICRTLSMSQPNITIVGVLFLILSSWTCRKLRRSLVEGRLMIDPRWNLELLSVRRRNSVIFQSSWHSNKLKLYQLFMARIETVTSASELNEFSKLSCRCRGFCI